MKTSPQNTGEFKVIDVTDSLKILFVFSKKAAAHVDEKELDRLLKQRIFNYYSLPIDAEIMVDNQTPPNKCFQEESGVIEEFMDIGTDFVDCYLKSQNKHILVLIDLEEAGSPKLSMIFVNQNGAERTSFIPLNNEKMLTITSESAFRINELAPYGHTQQF